MTGRTPLGLAAARLPEFLLTEEPGGTWKAIPRYEITWQLKAAGCLAAIRTETLEQLEEACRMERMKRARAAAQTHEDGPSGPVEPIELSPYLAEQLADLDPLRDDGGDVPHNADG
jgi:hypothetical protein